MRFFVLRYDKVCPFLPRLSVFAYGIMLSYFDNKVPFVIAAALIVSMSAKYWLSSFCAFW